MAEEKKFLNEEMEQSNHKLMVKYIALSVVIFVILILCVLAWFSSKQEANASGLTIKATADNGLQVAITDHMVVTEGGNTVHKNEWTPYAYQQTYHSSFTSSEPLPLISGNGLQFFEPSFIKVAENYYDKLDMDALEEEYRSNGKSLPWKDVTKDINLVTHEKEKYIEYKLRFRNNKKCNVFLTNESKVTPDSSQAYKPDTYKENTNSSGFSRNFISATARIAFLNKVTVDDTEKLNVHNLWIPNDDIELTHVDTTQGIKHSYKEIESTEIDSTVIKSSGSSGEGAYTGGTPSGYTLWINNSGYVKDETNGGNTVTLSTQNNRDKDMDKIVVDNKAGTLKGVPFYQVKLPEQVNGHDAYAYYVNLYIPAGTYSTNIPLIVTNNTALIWQQLNDDPSSFVANSQVVLYGQTGGNTGYTIGNYNISFQTTSNGATDGYCSNLNLTPGNSTDGNTYNYFETLYISNIIDSNNHYWPGGTIQISFANTRGLGAISSGYSKIVAGKDTGTQPTYDVKVNPDKYDIKVNDVLVFSASNEAGNNAISSSAPNTGEVVASPPDGETTHFWTVDSITAKGAFTLKNSSGNYLKIDSGNLTTVSTGGTQFYAVSKYEINGVAQSLKGIMLFTLDGNYFVNYDGKNFVCSPSNDTTYTYHIYKRESEEKEIPGSWGIRTSSPETNFFYRSVDPTNDQKTIKQQLLRTEYILSEDLNKENAIPSQYDPEENTTNHPNFIVSIGGKPDAQGFFVSEEITVRIWGEGYDREAQTPLQGGWMNVDLHFFAVEKDEE